MKTRIVVVCCVCLASNAFGASTLRQTTSVVKGARGAEGVRGPTGQKGSTLSSTATLALLGIASLNQRLARAEPALAATQRLNVPLSAFRPLGSVSLPWTMVSVQGITSLGRRDITQADEMVAELGLPVGAKVQGVSCLIAQHPQETCKMTLRLQRSADGATCNVVQKYSPPNDNPPYAPLRLDLSGAPDCKEPISPSLAVATTSRAFIRLRPTNGANALCVQNSANDGVLGCQVDYQP